MNSRIWAIAACIGCCYNALPQDSWVNNPNFKDVVYGHSLFVVVGDGGAVWTSANGLSWARNNIGLDLTIAKVVFTGSKFYGVGFEGGTPPQPKMFVSEDGTNWSIFDSNAFDIYYLEALAAGISNVVGVASAYTYIPPGGFEWRGQLGVTDTGTNWNFQEIQHESWIHGIAFGNSIYLAVGSSIWISQDGLTWLESFSPSPEPLTSVTYGAGLFIAAGQPGKIFTSTNGSNWTSVILATTNQLSSLGYGFGRFVAVGEQGTVLISTNGEDWLARDSGTSNTLQVTSIGGNRCIILTKSQLFWGTNWISWVPSFNGLGAPMNSVTYGLNKFVAVGYQDWAWSGASVWTSGDGLNWSNKFTSSTGPLYSVAYGNGLFVGVGDNGLVLTSLDAELWTTRSSGVTNQINGVAFGANGFVAVGNSGTMLASSNGTLWIQQGFATSNDLVGVTYGDGKFLAVGRASQISYVTPVFVSTNGVDWYLHEVAPDSNTYFQPSGVGFGCGEFVAPGFFENILPGGVSRDSIITSSDGATWVRRAGGGFGLSAVTFGNRSLVATGDGISVSRDGISWQWHSTGSGSGNRGVAFGNDRFVIVGNDVWVSIASPMITDSRIDWDGTFAFQVSAAADLRQTIEVSSNLVDWVPWVTVTVATNSFKVLDPSGTQLQRRFYRVVTEGMTSPE